MFDAEKSPNSTDLWEHHDFPAFVINGHELGYPPFLEASGHNSLYYERITKTCPEIWSFLAALAMIQSSRADPDVAKGQDSLTTWVEAPIRE